MMTTDQVSDLKAAILTAAEGLTKEDINDINSCNEEGLQLLLEGYVNQKKTLPPTTWQTILEVVKDIASFASLVMPIAQLAQTVATI